jgi:cell wall-associated NlpC family hydrolase
MVAALLLAGCAPKRVIRREEEASRTIPRTAPVRQGGAVSRDPGLGAARVEQGSAVSMGLGLGAARVAREQLGQPYCFGGGSPSCFDCSGLVQYCYREQGIELPRTVRKQVRVGREVAQHELLPGDLVFFRIRTGDVDHVGIYIGDDEFVHAPRRGVAVRKDRLTDPWWGHHFLTARRIY